MNDISVSAEDMEHEVDQGALLEFWNALIAGKDSEAAEIYQEDAVLCLPQSGKQVVGRTSIAMHALREPGESLVKVNRIIGDGELWVSECETILHQQLALLVSVAEMDDGKIVRETRYRVPKHVGPRATSS